MIGGPDSKTKQISQEEGPAKTAVRPGSAAVVGAASWPQTAPPPTGSMVPRLIEWTKYPQINSTLKKTRVGAYMRHDVFQGTTMAIEANFN